MMKAYLTRRYRFSASHRLHNDSFGEQQNREVYGKCNNPHGHGHNYALEVTVSGKVAEDTGMICDLGELDGCVAEQVLAKFDHQNLNLRSELADVVPTTENLAVVIYDILRREFKAARLEQVKIEETAKNSFTYSGGAEPILR
jgi:6-pyruvoyltetrahydropterin/6-carboxytetrahydropterin synthase